MVDQINNFYNVWVILNAWTLMLGINVRNKYKLFTVRYFDQIHILTCSMYSMINLIWYHYCYSSTLVYLVGRLCKDKSKCSIQVQLAVDIKVDCQTSTSQSVQSAAETKVWLDNHVGKFLDMDFTYWKTIWKSCILNSLIWFIDFN